MSHPLDSVVGWNELLFLPLQDNDDAAATLQALHTLYGGLLTMSDDEFRARVDQDVVADGGAGLDSFLHFCPRYLPTDNRAPSYRPLLVVLYGEVFRVLLRVFSLELDASAPFREQLWNQTRLLDMISLYGHAPLFFDRFTAAPHNAANRPLLDRLLAQVREQQELFADADSPEFAKILQLLTQWDAAKAQRAPAERVKPPASLRDSVESIIVPRTFGMSDIGLGHETNASVRDSILYEVLYDDDPDENRDRLQKFDLSAAENEDDPDNRAKRYGIGNEDLSDGDEPNNGPPTLNDDSDDSDEQEKPMGSARGGHGRGRGGGKASAASSSTARQPTTGRLSAAAYAKRSGRGRLNRTKRREAGVSRKGVHP